MKENTKLIISIFCIAFLIRFLFLLIMPQFFDRMFHFRDDWIYLTYAKNIISQGIWVPDITKMDLYIYGKQYNSHIVGPGYPLIISLIFILFGENIQIVMFLNVILSSLTCIVIYYLGKEVFNKQIGMFSSFWSITYVYFMVYMPRVLKENLLQLLIPLVILLMVYETKKIKLNAISILFPLTFTYLIHTDERYIIFFPIIFIGLISCDNINIINGLKKFTLFFIIMIVLSIPWTIRNYMVYDKMVILTIRTERIINPIIDKLNYYNISYINTKGDETDSSVEISKQNENNVLDINSINNANKFKDLVKDTFTRLKIYWAPMVLRESKFKSYVMLAGSLKYNLGGMLTFGILLPFFIVGSILTIKKNKLGLFLILFISIQSVLTIGIGLINPWPRYRYPIDSLVIIIAFYGLYQVLNLKNRKNFDVVLQKVLTLGQN